MMNGIRIASRSSAGALALLLALGCAQPDESTPVEMPPAHIAQASQTGTPQENTQVTDSESHPLHTNRLANETSPYLLQHAHNPVDWYPWGPEALEAAKESGKPIFLSVGYSSCHWCHVMERESFEKEDTAAVMNKYFISIKVDREERPDIDEIYMAAVQAMTGSGGWPMSVFLTPDLKPFYGGTYFPSEERYGRPGFKTVLERVADAWNTRRDEIIDNADKLTQHMQSLLADVNNEPDAITKETISNAARALAPDFDNEDGGFGGAPKFPNSAAIQLLLREYRRTGNASQLHMATLTLDKMATGGMYDHLGGGFARYSVDAQWLVPHFEKMLYGNAQLVQAYLDAYQVTSDPFYRTVAEETLDYLLRDMRDDRGGFYSAEDADSEGEEGKFYLWRHDEIIDVLGKDDAKLISAYYNVAPGGNFSSHETYHAKMNVLHTPRSMDDVAKELGLTVDEFQIRLAATKQKLFNVRAKRVRPGLDDKVLTSWNALTISAFAQAYQVLGDERYRTAATEAADFILTDMSRDGHLLRTYRAGESRLPAYLDDYAFFIVALADLYEATFDPRRLQEADRLAAIMIAEFWDPEANGFYFTSDQHKNLILRTRSSQDSAIPSGNSMAAYGLLRLAKFLDKPDYYDTARSLLESKYRYLAEVPRGFLKMVLAADFMVNTPKEIAIVGPSDDPATQALLRTVRESFLPNRIIAAFDPAAANANPLQEEVPLLSGKTLLNDRPAAYVCENFACKRPVTTPEELLEQLGVS